MTAEEFNRQELKKIGYVDEAIEEIVQNRLANSVYKFAEAYHLSKLNEITEKDIMDLFEKHSIDSPYDWVDGAKQIRNMYLTKAS